MSGGVRTDESRGCYRREQGGGASLLCSYTYRQEKDVEVEMMEEERLR